MDSCRHSVDVNCAPGSDVTWMGGGPKRAIQLRSTVGRSRLRLLLLWRLTRYSHDRILCFRL